MSAHDLLHDLRAAGFSLVAADGKLLVTPASALTDEMRVALRAFKSELLALVGRADQANHLRAVATRSCADCAHVLPRATCGEPLAAALRTAEEGFGIVWPPDGHGAACPAFAGKPPRATADRPHRLANDEADRCHAPCWDDAEIVAFTARSERFVLLGRADADDLAERLTLRDRDGDDRRLCLECTWLGDTGGCLAAKVGRLLGVERRHEPVQTILQRCEAFGLRKGLA